MASARGDSNDDLPFPKDISRDILLRLPVESLVRFKCVCKNLYALIESRSFIKEHLNRSNNNNNRPQLLVYDYGNDLSPITLISNQTPLLVEKPDQFQLFCRRMMLVCSVDGLILWARNSYDDDDVLALWNPATRESRLVSPAPFQPQPFFEGETNMYGLGLDILTDNYKVVCIRFYWDTLRDVPFHRPYPVVYSCLNDSWRIIKPKNCRMIACACSGLANAATYLNGTCYWLSERTYDCVLLSFDLGNEVFGVIGCPDFTGAGYKELALLDGSIALTVRNEMDYDLWVMIQPGVWNKLLNYQLVSPNIGPIHLHCGFWDSNTVIISTEGNPPLVSYDIEKQETRDLGFPHASDCRYLIIFYKKSLVSVKRRNEGWTTFT